MSYAIKTRPELNGFRSFVVNRKTQRIVGKTPIMPTQADAKSQAGLIIETELVVEQSFHKYTDRQFV